MKEDSDSYFSIKNIWKIAYPIILGSLAQDIITVVDTAFIGRLGEIELGGAAIGSVFYLAIVMIGWGFGLGVQILVARRFGENNIPAINKVIFHSFFILLMLALSVFAIIRIFDIKIFSSIIKSAAISEESLKYINIRVFGIFAAFMNINFRAFYIGTSNTKIISYTTALMALINIGLDYLLIFGIGGFPEMGIQGAALASVIAEYCALLYFIVSAIKSKKNTPYKLLKLQRPDWHFAKGIFSVATPTMIQNFISLSAWFFFFLMVEKMGETPLAISNIIRSIYIVVLIPIMGFSSATNTLVSYAIGNKTKKDIWPIIKRTLALTIGCVACLVLIALVFPKQIIGSYTSIKSIANATLPVFYVIMLASFTLAFGFVLFQAVSGTGNTKTALLIEVIVLCGYLLGIMLTTTSNAPSIILVWSMEFCYGIGLGTLSLLYLKYGKWHLKEI
ncbi:MAG: MATE family efflux transporter [Salinivirgaceae bacterium]|jgi:putative MATE family efflux protein|nr:MATE family efflux transporter [Salinivirgaceae bacterium]